MVDWVENGNEPAGLTGSAAEVLMQTIPMLEQGCHARTRKLLDGTGVMPRALTANMQA
jgi:hypothetical protein